MSNLRGRTTSATSLNRLSNGKVEAQKSAKKKSLSKPAWDVIKSFN